jgi:hypothetical protein
MSTSTGVILGLRHIGWGHISKFLYTCPLWPLRGLWCQGQGSVTLSHWRPLNPLGDDELFLLFFRPYVGICTHSWSSSLRGVTFWIHLASPAASVVPTSFSLPCNTHTSKSYHLKSVEVTLLRHLLSLCPSHNKVWSKPWSNNIWDTSDQRRLFGGYNRFSSKITTCVQGVKDFLSPDFPFHFPPPFWKVYGVPLFPHVQIILLSLNWSTVFLII